MRASKQRPPWFQTCFLGCEGVSIPWTDVILCGMAGGVLPSGSCLDFPPWWTMEASEPFLPCAALGREYFITATESKQGISTFGWLLEDGEGGGGSYWMTQRGRTGGYGESMYKAPKVSEQPRSHEDGPGWGEAEAGWQIRLGHTSLYRPHTDLRFSSKCT